MWQYYIELFTDRCYGCYVEGAEVFGDGLPVCSDLSVSKAFDNPEDLNLWVVNNTSLKVENMDYGIKGIYYPKTRE